MRESNLEGLSRRRFPRLPRPGCVDGVSRLVVSSHEVMNSYAGATKQPCNTCYTDSGGHITLILTLT